MWVYVIDKGGGGEKTQVKIKGSRPSLRKVEFGIPKNSEDSPRFPRGA